MRSLGVIGCSALLLVAGKARADVPTPATSSDVTDVTVAGTRPDPTQTTLRGSEVRQVPGAFGDAFRAVDALPGVVPMASGLPYFFIRGAPPGDTVAFIDGVRVPLLYHAAFGPSVIHPSLVDRLDFFPSGAPVSYGRAAGAVFSASLPPPPDVFRAEGNVRLFDAGALVESPFDGGRATAEASGRYSYSGLVLSAISPVQVQYWDYQTRETFRLTDKDTIGLFAFGSYDDLGQVTRGKLSTIIDDQFHRVDLRWDHALSDGGVRVAGTLGYGRSADSGDDIEEFSGSLRASLEDRLARDVTLRAGANADLDRYVLLENAVPDTTLHTSVLYPDHDELALGVYADVVWRVTPRVQVVPGIRADLFGTFRSDDVAEALRALAAYQPSTTTSVLPAVDPRLATRVDVAKGVSLLSSVGVAEQPAAFVVPVPALTFVEPNPSLQTAFEMSQGVRVALPWEVTLEVTGFLNEYRQLTDLTATCPNVFGAGFLLGDARGVLNSLCLTDTVRGQAFGGEVSLKRSLTRRLTGLVSYTLSRSTREQRIAGELGVTKTFTVPDAFDRTHVLSAMAAYDLGARWRAGARFVFYTGLPYSHTIDGVQVAPYEDARMPAFWRIDLRLEKSWKIGERGSVAVVLEGMNVTLNKEVLGVACAPAPDQPIGHFDPCTFQYFGPVAIPSIGVEGKY